MIKNNIKNQKSKGKQNKTGSEQTLASAQKLKVGSGASLSEELENAISQIPEQWYMQYAKKNSFLSFSFICIVSTLFYYSQSCTK